jgi:large subunit ribosomal protein L24
VHVRKNDTVEVIAGNYKGKQGKVLRVVPVKRRAVVEGVNFIKRHTKPSQKQAQGGIIEREGTINVSNLMVICPKCSQRTKVGYRLLTDGGRERVCKRCDEMLSSE